MTTLRFWEKAIPEVAPIRTPGRTRYYTPELIRKLRIVRFLVHDRGLRLEAVREQLRLNPKNVSTRMEVLDTLTNLRDEIQQLLTSFNRRKD